MVFFQAFKDRIRSQIGVGQWSEEDYSFLKPGGNDHWVQFCFKSFSEAYDDFDDWDRNHLLLGEILADTGIDFQLDADGSFARLVTTAEKGTRAVQSVMDLRDELLVSVYYFGESRQCRQLNQKLIESGGLQTCYLDSEALLRLVPVFDKVHTVQFDFEQLPSLFLEPVILKGTVEGACTENTIKQFLDRQGYYFNVEAIGGFLADGARGKAILRTDGSIQAESCRLGGFMDIAERTFTDLRTKYGELSARHIVAIEEASIPGIMKISGNPLAMRFPFAVDRIDGLGHFFTRGNRQDQFFGLTERRSRSLWSVRTTEMTSGKQMAIEYSDRFVRFFLHHRHTISLLALIERFIRKHISATLAVEPV